MMDDIPMLQPARRGAMTAFMKASMVGVLGVMILVSMAAVGLAAPPGVAVYDRCVCSCRSADQYKDLVSRDVSHCNLNGMDCTFTLGTTKYKGKLDSCSLCVKGGACTPVKGATPFGGPGGLGGGIRER